jgi:transposase
MSESIDIDSPFEGGAMPKSGDLRERVIATVVSGASRRAAAEVFEVAASTAVKWVQRWHDSGSSAPKLRGGSTSRLEKHAAVILALVDEQPDATLNEILAALRKRRIRSSRSALWRFFDRHDITFKKKACGLRNSIARTWPGRAGAGSESKACLTPPGWCFLMRRQSART